MRNQHVNWPLALLLAAVALLGGQLAFAQLRIVGAISGTVQDPSGAVVPVAKIVLKDEGTGITKEATATGIGTFTFPDLAHGLYEVTVTADGFQKAVVAHIEVSASQTTDVKVELKVGQAAETVTVEGVAPILETSSNLTNSTTGTKLATELPTGGRSPGLEYAQLVPGYTPSPTGGGGRINNVVGGAVNTSIDGINNASNGWKSGGTVWYGTVPVRLGALEEVTVESGGLGADSGAESGVNVKMITKRGGSQYHGSVFYQPQSEQFNANSWSNNAQGFSRTKNRRHDFGGNIGGKLVPFGYLKDKLFFFFNYEYSWHPAVNNVTTAIMTDEAKAGIYKYIVYGTTNQVAQVNVMSIAAQKGAPTALDPIAAEYEAMNAKIKQYAQQVSTTDLNTTNWRWNQDNSDYQYYPTTRFDYYVTPKHQLSFMWNYYHSWDPGSPRFPWPDSKLTGPYRVGYFIWAAALQSSFTPTTINEFRYGTQHSGDSNASATDKYGTYNSYNGKPFRIGGSLPFGTMTPYIDQVNTTGRHYITTMYDTVTMMRGQHTIRAGFTFRRTDWKDLSEVWPIPTYGQGTPSGDPIPGNLFTTATVPGINPNSLPGGPASLYNELVGRVASTRYNTFVDPATKQYGGTSQFNWTRSYMGGLWFQDSWRVTPALTLNYGLRWEAQGDQYDVMGMSATPDMKDIYGPSVALFTPGLMSGNYDPVGTIGRHAYPPDWKNFAPNLGFAWNPRVDSGLLGRVLGGSKTVFRGSYGITYYDEGTLMYSGSYGCGPGTGVGCNAGKSAVQSLQAGTTTALPQWSTLAGIAANPVPLSAFTGITPYSPVLHQNLNTFSSSWAGMKPNLVAPYVIQWNFSVQREVARNLVLEVRYAGNQSHRQWRTQNLNEVNIFENGFLDEFKHAKANLDINAANGKANTFAYNGLPGQFQLPIMSAAFGARGTVPAQSNSNGFGSTTFINYLNYGAAGSFAGSLTGQNYFCRMMGNNFSPCLLPGIAPSGTSYNAPGAGFPINFFTLNPYTTSMNFVEDSGWANYNGLQTQLRKTFSHGVTGTFNYTWAHGMSNTGADNATMSANWMTMRNPSLDRRSSLFDRRHTISSLVTYDLPVGKDRLLKLNNRWFDMLVGGWTASSTVTFSTGAPNQFGGNYSTFNTFAPQGVVLANGITLQQLSDMFHGQPLIKVNQAGSSDGRLNRTNANDWTRIAVPLDLIGPDGRANPTYITWNTTPGTIGQVLYIAGKNAFNWNAAMTKTFAVTERIRLQLYADAQNVLNHPTWGMGNLGTYSTGFGTIGAPSGQRSMTFRGLVNF